MNLAHFEKELHNPFEENNLTKVELCVNKLHKEVKYSNDFRKELCDEKKFFADSIEVVS